MTPTALTDALLERLLDRARNSNTPASPDHKPALLVAVRAAGWRPAYALRQATRPRSSSSDADLARAFREGNADAFDELYSRYHGKLIAYARRSGCSQEAADAAQEAFIALIRTAPVYEPDFNLPAYLFTVVRNRAIKLGARRSGAPLSDEAAAALEDPADGPLEQLIARYGLLRIAAILEERCTPTEQAVLALTHEGRNATQIAAELETTPGNVRVVRNRARKKLRAALDEDPS